MLHPTPIIVAEAKSDANGLVGVGAINDKYVARRAREQLNTDAIPADFYRREVKAGDRCYLIFASDSQIQLLKHARRWYIDGTFKTFLHAAVHAFVRRGDCSKQVPLLYVLISGRYIKVFKVPAVLHGLEYDIAVEEVVCDYEVALWKSVQHVFPEVTIRGCGFHWRQAVWRHVQVFENLGMATEYLQEGGTYTFIRKLLCLPFLPAEHIQPTFRALSDLNSATQLEPLLEYMNHTWFQSATWLVENWCVFGQSVRTNNDCEGWHRRLNVRAGIAPPFYLLIKLLHREAKDVEDQVQLVNELSLHCLQRKTYRSMQSALFNAWDSYRAGEVTATGLLKMVLSTSHMSADQTVIERQ